MSISLKSTGAQYTSASFLPANAEDPYTGDVNDTATVYFGDGQDIYGLDGTPEQILAVLDAARAALLDANPGLAEADVHDAAQVATYRAAVGQRVAVTLAGPVERVLSGTLTAVTADIVGDLYLNRFAGQPTDTPVSLDRIVGFRVIPTA